MKNGEFTLGAREAREVWETYVALVASTVVHVPAYVSHTSTASSPHVAAVQNRAASVKPHAAPNASGSVHCKQSPVSW